jgi:GT2 family glycosyltransferase
MDKKPLVSVIIVNFNGAKYVRHCLEGILKNNYPSYEIIICDNGSTDGSEELVKKIKIKYHHLFWLGLGKNYGPAYARNKGAEIAKGKYLAFLDNDTFPEPDWLKFPVEEMERNPKIGAVQCKLLLMEDHRKIDYVGDYLSQFGLLVQRVKGGELDKGQADEKVEILSAKSAAMVIRKKAFEEAGGFDSDYFIYVEETDLAWRVWLKGYRIIFVPDSRVYHEFGTSASILGNFQQFLNKYHAPKNYLMTLYKNLGLGALVKILPVHFLLWLGVAFWFVIKRQFKLSWFVVLGLGWFILNLPKNTVKRIKVQKSRVISDKELLPIIMRKQPLSYFLNKLRTVHKIGNTTSFYVKK